MTLPARSSDKDEQQRADRVAAAYRSALVASGARTVDLRPDRAVAAIDGLDGVLLTGGGDLEPWHYGCAVHEKTEPPDKARDEFELALARLAIARGIPVLGICRGAQVLGVVLGGQLLQDIDSGVREAAEHRSLAAGHTARHWIELAPGSRLAAIMGGRRALVNSFHHQANAQLGPGAIRAAWSLDDVTEAVEIAGPAFAIGVQWHPERMWRKAPRQRRLFAAFVDACRADGGNRG